MMSRPLAAGCDPAWEKIFSRREWGRYPPEHVVRFIARNFRAAVERGQARLLEIGCGTGTNLWLMAREGFRTAGIDGSPSAIRKANQRLNDEGLWGDLRLGDYATLPWPDNSFDGVLENVSLYCNPWESIEQTLREVRRVLKPGGKFQSSFFSTKTWGFGMGREVGRNAFTDIPEGPMLGTGFALFLDREDVDKLFLEFEDVQVERISWTMEGERHMIEQFVIVCANGRR